MKLKVYNCTVVHYGVIVFHVIDIDQSCQKWNDNQSGTGVAATGMLDVSFDYSPRCPIAVYVHCLADLEGSMQCGPIYNIAL